MLPFGIARPRSVAEAIALLGQNTAAKIIAGGTNLVDLMKENVERPTTLVDVNHLPLTSVEMTSGGGLEIGALVRNADLAAHPSVVRHAPLLRDALLAGASPQLRNVATTGGNLLQRTRCYYFYDVATPCNKRSRGEGCSARVGLNRIHAIFGASDDCVATHPSDMCVALAALDATVVVESPAGQRRIPFADFHRLPGNTPDMDTTLARDEVIVSVSLPPGDFAGHHSYLKIRDRKSYAFALVSVAAALKIEDGRIRDARLALGGVAHKPWRNRKAEQSLIGQAPHTGTFRAVAAAIVSEARPLRDNAYKVSLTERAILRALGQAADAKPHCQTSSDLD